MVWLIGSLIGPVAERYFTGLIACESAEFAAARALSLPSALLISVLVSLQGSVVIQQEDVSISYLPLAHMFERMIQVADPLRLLDVSLFVHALNLTTCPLMWQVTMFCHGAKVGFYQGDISLLMDDIKTLKPTFFPVVPRLLNRIYDKVSNLTQALNLASTSIKNSVFNFNVHFNTQKPPTSQE